MTSTDTKSPIIHVKRADVDEQITMLQRLLEDKRALPSIEDVANARGQIASLRLVLRNFAPADRKPAATTTELSKAPQQDGPSIYGAIG